MHKLLKQPSGEGASATILTLLAQGPRGMHPASGLAHAGDVCSDRTEEVICRSSCCHARRA